MVSKTVKRVLYFIGLKLIEITGILLFLALTYFLGSLFVSLEDVNGGMIGLYACRICVGLLIDGLLGLLGILVYYWISSNWEYAGKLSEKSK